MAPRSTAQLPVNVLLITVSGPGGWQMPPPLLALRATGELPGKKLSMTLNGPIEEIPPPLPLDTLLTIAQLIIVSDPGDPQCAAGAMRRGGAPLTSVNVRCANIAVPLTRDIVARIDAARAAVEVQRALIALGYDAGPLGAIDEPRAADAIRQMQQDMGWPVTGEATWALQKILWLRMRTS